MNQRSEFSILIQEILSSTATLFQNSDYKPDLWLQWLDKIPHAHADFNVLTQYLVQNPQWANDQFWIYSQEAQRLLQNQTQYWSGIAPFPELSEDRRFSAEEWSNHPFFQLISQHYILLEKHLLNLFNKIPTNDQPSIKRVQFLIQHAYQAFSPENFLLTNPLLLNETMQNNGLNLLQGLRNFLQDIQTQGINLWTLPLSDSTTYAVGKNLAVTPGKVVYQNELIELIQYIPQTKKVGAIPLLMIPPWINKYYILDLRPENSLARWLVEQGIMVFIISWRNPDQSHAHLGLSEYLQLGPIAAIEAMQNILQVSQVSTLGFCIGGTLLSMLLAYYKAQNKQVIASATFLASLIDFSDPGELGVFIHEQQIQVLEQRMQEQGYLDGGVMAAAFNMLRPNDLIWKVFAQRYLLGQPPGAFDLLFWNMDTTNMPAKMHSEYLRNLYLANDLVKPGKLLMNDIPLDISAIEIPAFFLSTQKDHIAVWQSTYRGFNLLNGPKKFVLGGSGHIAGIVIPPGKDKYGYYTNENYPVDPEDWIKNADHHSGSWWPLWLDWLKEYTGNSLQARPFIKNLATQGLYDAPGKYVHTKST